MCAMMKPWKLELTPGRRTGRGPGHRNGAFLPLPPTGKARAAGGAALLSTDQLQPRQARVTCDSQCQFHARGNHLRKSWAGFTFDKKSAAFVFVKRPITECDRSPRLPAPRRPVWSLSGTRKYLFQMGSPPAAPSSRDVKINCQSLFTAIQAGNTEDFRLNCQLTEFKIERRTGPGCLRCTF